MDDKGRIVVPAYLREALGIEVSQFVDIERYPIEGDCKALFIKKVQLTR